MNNTDPKMVDRDEALRQIIEKHRYFCTQADMFTGLSDAQAVAAINALYTPKQPETKQCPLCSWNKNTRSWGHHMVKVHGWHYYDGKNAEPRREYGLS